MNGVKPIRIPRRERPCPTEADVLKLLQERCFHEGYTARFIMMVAILATMGLRITEAASIKKADIHFHTSEVRIIGKGNKERFVPLQPMTRALIAQYLHRYPNDSEWLFPADNKLGYWDIRSFEESLRKMCHKVGITPITPHQLRHYFATYALKDGAKLEVVSRILGHASVAITADCYRHMTREELHQEMQAHGPLSRVAPPRLLPEGGIA